MKVARTFRPSRRALFLAAVGLAIPVTIAAMGLVARADNARTVTQWTKEQSVPTVALATLRQDNAQGLTLPGTIQPFSKAAIYARVNGYLKSWSVDIGAHVKAGQMMAMIDTPDLDHQLEQAKADLATAGANEKLAAVTAERWQTLLKQGWVSQQATDDKNGAAAADKAVADAAGANVRTLEAMEGFKTIAAPFDGIVTARKTDIGALINAGSTGQELFEVSDTARVRIYVQVPQSFSAGLTPGAKATLALPQYPGRTFEATVETSSQALDVNSRSMLVELQADNASGMLAPGAYCQVQFTLTGNPDTVRVPATALIAGDQATQVAVLNGDNTVALKTVQLGRDFGDSAEVVAGLAPSDRVIDSPPETLQNGDHVRLQAPAAS